MKKNQSHKPLIVPQKRHELTPQGKKYTSVVMVNVREWWFLKDSPKEWCKEMLGRM